MPTKSRSLTTTKRVRTTKPAAAAAGLVSRRLPRALPPTHPGEMLLEEFLRPLGISQSAFAVRLGVSFPRLNEVVRGKRAVTPDTALRGGPHADEAFADDLDRITREQPPVEPSPWGR